MQKKKKNYDDQSYLIPSCKSVLFKIPMKLIMHFKLIKLFAMMNNLVWESSSSHKRSASCDLYIFYFRIILIDVFVGIFNNESQYIMFLIPSTDFFWKKHMRFYMFRS